MRGKLYEDRDYEYGMDPLGRFRFHGIYSAKVEDTNDPLKQGRIKVKIQQTTGQEVTGWAKPCLGGVPSYKTPYGVFSSSQTQTVAGANTVTLVTYNTTEEASGVSYTNNSRIKVTHEGVYNFAFSAQLSKTASPDASIDIWFRKNGVNIPNSNSRIDIKNPPQLIAAWNYMLTLKPTDYVEMAFSSADTSMRLLASGASTTPVRPAIPSVIATINLVSKFKPNKGDLVWVMFEAGDPEYPVWIGVQ